MVTVTGRCSDVGKGDARGSQRPGHATVMGVCLMPKVAGVVIKPSRCKQETRVVSSGKVPLVKWQMAPGCGRKFEKDVGNERPAF